MGAIILILISIVALIIISVLLFFPDKNKKAKPLQPALPDSEIQKAIIQEQENIVIRLNDSIASRELIDHINLIHDSHVNESLDISMDQQMIIDNDLNTIEESNSEKISFEAETSMADESIENRNHSQSHISKSNLNIFKF